MKNKKARLIDALGYLRYCYKEGAWEPDEKFDKMTTEQIIIMAEDMAGQAEAEYDVMKDEGSI